MYSELHSGYSNTACRLLGNNLYIGLWSMRLNKYYQGGDDEVKERKNNLE